MSSRWRRHRADSVAACRAHGDQVDGLVDLGFGDRQRRREPQRGRRDGVARSDPASSRSRVDGLGVDAVGQLGAEQQPGTADSTRHPESPQSRRRAVGPAVAGEGRRIDAPHLVDDRVDGRGGDRGTAVGAAVVARLEHRCDVARAPSTAPTGIPLPIALASVTTSGATPACSNPNHAPVRPKPVWISSTIISAPVSSHSSRIPAQVAGVAPD